MSTEVENKELSLLREKADLLGIEYHPNTGAKKLAELISEREAELEGAKPVAARTASAASDRSHLEMMRVLVVPLDDTKAAYDGEYFTVGNSVIGTFRYFVPYNLTQGWHLPRIIVDMLKEKRFQKFVVKKNKQSGIEESHSIDSPQFSVQELEPLTKEELKKLADSQRARAAID